MTNGINGIAGNIGNQVAVMVYVNNVAGNLVVGEAKLAVQEFVHDVAFGAQLPNIAALRQKSGGRGQNIFSRVRLRTFGAQFNNQLGPRLRQ